MARFLRRLNEDGIAHLRGYLAQLRTDGSIAPPMAILEAEATSEFVAGSVSLDTPGFVTKFEAASYLLPKLLSLGLPDLMEDQGLWTWLSLFYFDDVCPREDGRRHPVADPHYILDSHNYARIYRHLLRTPVLIMQAMPDHNRIFLNAPLTIHGDLIEQSMGRLAFIRIPAVREAIDLLYYDLTAGKIKSGAMTRTRRGNLRSRLTVRVQQLSLTYDIAAMNGTQLIAALGDEFSAWSTA